MKIYFAADHAGFDLKNELIDFVNSIPALPGETAFEAEDCGAFALDPADDYPAIIAAAAQKLSLDASNAINSFAVLIGASGQGEAIVANRFKGVRCVVYYGAAAHTQTDTSGQQLDMLASTRQHNHANALSLGARFLTPEEAKDAMRVWLSVPVSDEDRHMRRVAQIDQIA